MGDGNMLLTYSYTTSSDAHDKRIKFHFTTNYQRLVT